MCVIVSLLDEYPYVNVHSLDVTSVESLKGTKTRRPRGIRETTLSPLGNDEESGSNNGTIVYEKLFPRRERWTKHNGLQKRSDRGPRVPRSGPRRASKRTTVLAR